MKMFSYIDKKIGIILGLLTVVLLFSISNAFAQTYEDPLRRPIILSEPTSVPNIKSIPPQKRTSVKLHIDGIRNILFRDKYPSTQTPLRFNKIKFSIRIEVLEDLGISTHSRLVVIIKDSEGQTRGFKVITLENVFQDINQYKKKNLDKIVLKSGESLVTRYAFRLPKSARLGKWQICPILYSREGYETHNLNLNSPPTFGSFNYEHVKPISIKRSHKNKIEIVSQRKIRLLFVTFVITIISVISLLYFLSKSIDKWKNNQSYENHAIACIILGIILTLSFVFYTF